MREIIKYCYYIPTQRSSFLFIVRFARYKHVHVANSMRQDVFVFSPHYLREIALKSHKRKFVHDA
jgi:hypothetical protein